jgi:hypothetical protein
MAETGRLILTGIMREPIYIPMDERGKAEELVYDAYLRMLAADVIPDAEKVHDVRIANKRLATEIEEVMGRLPKDNVGYYHFFEIALESVCCFWGGEVYACSC